MAEIVHVDTTRLDRILRNLDTNTTDAVKAIAFSIEAEAKKRAPVDTGALRASIYARIGSRGVSNRNVIAEARSRNPEIETVELPKPDDEVTAHIGPSVEYGIYVELGTSRSGAQPYLVPAVRKVEQDLVNYLEDIVTDG